MFWVVQNNIYKEQKHSVLMETLRELEIPHVEVKVAPFFDKLLPSNFDTHEYKGSIDEIKEVKINEEGPVIVLGATTLAKIAKQRGWNPGSFLNENFHYNEWKKHLGKHLLNEESSVGRFRTINPNWEEFFIRPCEDTKDFNGAVYTKEEFKNWRNGLLEVEGTCPFADSEVVASPYKKILAEYRFFVVDGQVVTYSRYKLGDTISASGDVHRNIVSFAQQMVDMWQPARAFVIDIAATEEGLRVIEINNFNSAGFYDSDVKKLITSIENMEY